MSKLSRVHRALGPSNTWHCMPQQSSCPWHVLARHGKGGTSDSLRPSYFSCAELLRHPYLALHMPLERLPYVWAEALSAAVPPAAGPLSSAAGPAMLFEPATPPRHAPRSERTADSGMSLDSAGTALPSGSGKMP